ncbi:MAG: hypothetical protein ABI156_13565 [Caldimonas sp.]
MHPSPVVLFLVLVTALAAGAARAADDLPDDAALQLADQAPAETQKASAWRMYGEAAVSRGWQRSPASTEDGVRASFDLRYDGTLTPGLRAVLSDRLDLLHDNSQPDQRNVNALREAYVSWKFRPDVTVDLGRVNLRHGAAWGYNPTDYFKSGALRSIVSPDPASLRENRLGTVLLQAQKVWSDSSFSAALAPKLADAPSDAAASLDLGATNASSRWLLAASHKFGAGSIRSCCCTAATARRPRWVSIFRAC